MHADNVIWDGAVQFGTFNRQKLCAMLEVSARTCSLGMIRRTVAYGNVARSLEHFDVPLVIALFDIYILKYTISA